ncbi:class C sortase [Lysinibacter sp. HNR]|uniref:class C sortase n=1 Tax=Lysinibacter sp. HNR TaxID=3031408 RepID=UPI0024357C98|nr:class C sortase [Lysinibacter sp. HNR]WGD36933.1 class C sortase [Lysinibacter sp. HNR]
MLPPQPTLSRPKHGRTHRRTVAPSRLQSRSPLWQRISLLLATILGLSVTLYPTAATWFTDTAQGGTLDAFANLAEHLPNDEKQRILDAAHDYNESLPQGELRDPYSLPNNTSSPSSDVTDDYFKQLNLEGIDVMARVRIPSINVDIPTYHGTSMETLDRGSGHILGSSLPVGGEGTHSVITAHAGLPHARMFTDLPRVKKGETFSVTVLDEVLTYRVDQITVVEPHDISNLTITPGKDYLTLITCTPLHINSHRLLIRGERIPTPVGDPQLVSAQYQSAFPWWILIFVGLSAGAAVLLFTPARSAKKPAKPAAQQKLSAGNQASVEELLGQL